jgi:hypothetical protein
MRGAYKMAEKVMVVLENGTEVKSSKNGWNVEEIEKKGIPVLAEGWDAGKGVHFGLSLGYLKAIAEQLPDYVLGVYKAGIREVPVIDSIKLTNDIKSDWAELKELKVEVVKLARNASKAKAALKEVASDPEMLALIKEKNPALYETLVKGL